jgi:hypothetical protein
MPTSLDRVQVLLQPEEYAELHLIAKEDRRSLAAMAAVLINEAIKARIREGTFTPKEDDPAYAKAKQRQVARMLGKKAEEEGKGSIDDVIKELGGEVAYDKKTINEALSLKTDVSEEPEKTPMKKTRKAVKA